MPSDLSFSQDVRSNATPRADSRSFEPIPSIVAGSTSNYADTPMTQERPRPRPRSAAIGGHMWDDAEYSHAASRNSGQVPQSSWHPERSYGSQHVLSMSTRPPLSSSYSQHTPIPPILPSIENLHSRGHSFMSGSTSGQYTPHSQYQSTLPTHSSIHDARVPLESDPEELPEHITPLVATVQSKRVGKRRAKCGAAVDAAPPQKKAKGPAGESRARATKAATPKVKMEPGVEAKSTGKRGRAAGAVGYTDAEVTVLLGLIRDRRPIGGKGWEWIASEYAKWATKCSKPLRNAKSLKAKFDALVNYKKPTGQAKVPALVETAREVEALISDKAAVLTVDDSDFEDPVLSNDDEDTDADAANEIIELSDDDDDDIQETPSVSKKKGSVLTKAYRVEPPLPEPKRNRVTAASEALASITSVFNHTALKQRDASRMAHNVQITQQSALQTELREMRARIDMLQDRITAETRRADRAEAQVDMMKMLHDTVSTSQHRRRTPDRCHHYTPSPSRHYRRHTPSPLQSRRRRYHDTTPSRSHRRVKSYASGSEASPAQQHSTHSHSYMPPTPTAGIAVPDASIKENIPLSMKISEPMCLPLPVEKSQEGNSTHGADLNTLASVAAASIADKGPSSFTYTFPTPSGSLTDNTF